MSNTPTPTAGAMNAAKAANEFILPCLHGPACYRLGARSLVELAAIFDDVTGLPELVAACEAVAKGLDVFCGLTLPGPGDYASVEHDAACEWLDTLNTALAKAGEQAQEPTHGD